MSTRRASSFLRVSGTRDATGTADLSSGSSARTSACPSRRSVTSTRSSLRMGSACGVQELCTRYGADTVTDAMTSLLDYSERRMRAAIAMVPDGVYEGEAIIDDDGLGREPLRVRATVTIDGDQLHVDFAGTAPQTQTNINCPFASTIAAALSCVKSVLTSPDIPFNEGSKRPITVVAPHGSLVNPRPPAPVRARMLSGYRVFNAVMSALANVVPDRVIAEGFDTTEVVCLSHRGNDGYRIYLEIFGGGYGASAH